MDASILAAQQWCTFYSKRWLLALTYVNIWATIKKSIWNTASMFNKSKVNLASFHSWKRTEVKRHSLSRKWEYGFSSTFWVIAYGLQLQWQRPAMVESNARTDSIMLIPSGWRKGWDTTSSLPDSNYNNGRVCNNTYLSIFLSRTLKMGGKCHLFVWFFYGLYGSHQKTVILMAGRIRTVFSHAYALSFGLISWIRETKPSFGGVNIIFCAICTNYTN